VETIATAAMRCLHPWWLDDNTLEYDDPAGTGWLTRTTP